MEPLFLHKLILGLAGFILLLAAASDAARFRIPNLASLALTLLFPAFVLTAPTPLPWIEHIAVGLIVLAGGFYLYARKWAGAGDVKLLAVATLWAGPLYWGLLLFMTAIAGGVLSLGIGAWTLVRHRLAKTGEPLVLAKTPIPYGVAIAMGGLCVLFLLSHPDLAPKI